jgi:hypothetical protein
VVGQHPAILLLRRHPGHPIIVGAFVLDAGHTGRGAQRRPGGRERASRSTVCSLLAELKDGRS